MTRHRAQTDRCCSGGRLVVEHLQRGIGVPINGVQLCELTGLLVAAQRRRVSRTAAGAISAVCADIQGGCVGSMQPELRERLGLGRVGVHESGWSTATATAMITAPSTAANVSRRDGHSSGPAEHFRVRSARRWGRWGWKNGTMRRGSVWWC